MSTTKRRITHKKPQLSFWTVALAPPLALPLAPLTPLHVLLLQCMRKSQQISLGPRVRRTRVTRATKRDQSVHSQRRSQTAKAARK